MTFHLKGLARLCGLLAVTVLLLGLTFVSTPSAEAAVSPSAATTAAYEARVIYATNIQRLRYKRHKLVAAACPDRYAEGWAAYLARTGAFRHQSMYPILKGCRATRVAENLARGGVGADRIVAAWMASPGHRANILDARLTQIGVAAVYARGRWTVVADFMRP